jgi:hypothetical protein
MIATAEVEGSGTAAISKLVISLSEPKIALPEGSNVTLAS